MRMSGQVRARPYSPVIRPGYRPGSLLNAPLFVSKSILLRPALDGDDAERSVLVADLAVLLVLLRGMPGLSLLHALPLLDGDSFRRRAFEHGAVARGKQLAAFFLDQRLRLRRVLLHVRVVVADIDLGDRVDRRLRLRVQRVNGNASEPEACDDGQRDAGTSLHSFPFAVWCCGLRRRVLLQEQRRAIIVPTDS